MKKQFYLVIGLAVVIVILLGVLVFLPKKNTTNNPPVVESIQVTSPAKDAVISSPLKITGKTTTNGWAGFEGQVGTVKILDYKGNQIGETAILTATTDWMQPEVNFEANLNFVSDKDQSATLVFKNENPSGDPSRDKTFTLPVKIAKTAGELMSVKVFFNNNKLDPEVSCNKAFPVVRQIPKTESVGSAALQQLLAGPTEAEKKDGYSTSINSGVSLNMLTIGVESGTARADFDENLDKNIGGSCRVSAIRAQITQTLLQFPTIKSVVISINGRTEDILQP